MSIWPDDPRKGTPLIIAHAEPKIVGAVREDQTRLIVERLRAQQHATESVAGLDTAAELIEHWFG